MGFQAMVILLLGLALPAIVSCNLEGDVLHAQRTAWEDPNNVLQSWDPTLVNPCTWFHITCNNDNSVIRVDLGNAGLSGPLIPQLGELANLQYLELFENNLSGTIPNALGNLTNLVSLGLQNNLLSGVIPPSLGNMVALRYLELSANNLTGSIPSALGNLSSLVSLGLQNNVLSGIIPSSLSNIKTLKYLRLNGNALSGNVPTEVLDLVLTGNLIEMNVSQNMLTGTVRSSNVTVATIIQDSKASD